MQNWKRKPQTRQDNEIKRRGRGIGIVKSCELRVPILDVLLKDISDWVLRFGRIIESSINKGNGTSSRQRRKKEPESEEKEEMGKEVTRETGVSSVVGVDKCEDEKMGVEKREMRQSKHI